METAPAFRLALDVGGTFTDFVLEGAGAVTYGKVLRRRPSR